MSDDRVHYSELLDGLRLERERIETTLRDLEMEVENARNARAAIDLLIDRCTPLTETEVEVSLNGTNGHGSLFDVGEDDNESGSHVCGNATVGDIVDCKTQRECLYVIARKNDCDLDLNPAADLILAAGKSRGMRSTVVSTLHHFMTNSDDWEWVGPSHFRLVTDSRSDGSSTDSPVEPEGPEFIGETERSELTETVE